MSPRENFYSKEEIEISESFLKYGYVIRDVVDTSLADEMRSKIVEIACAFLGIPAPKDNADFLNNIQKEVGKEQVNDFRLHIYQTLNKETWLRPTYYSLAKPYIDQLVGNELAMQNRVNLSIQLPHDESSTLSMHTDLHGGETPFQVVEWLPLVDTYKTKSMFILPPEKNREIVPKLPEYDQGGMSKIFKEVKDDLVWLDVPYGKVLLFSTNLFHGNIINEEKETRWSLNCRITGLFTPYGNFEKKIGSFYLPITTKTISRIGMDCKFPNWKKNKA